MRLADTTVLLCWLDSCAYVYPREHYRGRVVGQAYLPLTQVRGRLDTRGRAGARFLRGWVPLWGGCVAAQTYTRLNKFLLKFKTPSETALEAPVAPF
jgi:hypothetical protein